MERERGGRPPEGVGEGELSPSAGCSAHRPAAREALLAVAAAVFQSTLLCSSPSRALLASKGGNGTVAEIRILRTGQLSVPK